MSASRIDSFDVAVIGGGATGLASAITAAIAGWKTVLFAPPAQFPPGRTAALLGGSIDLLSRLDVWQALAHRAAPLRAIRIVDATGRLIRSPETLFHASEIDLPAFGYNVGNGDLVEALRRHAASFTGLRMLSVPVESVAPEPDWVVLRSSEGEVRARLAVAADGARSRARDAAGIRMRSWSHRQSALVTTLATARPHGGVSTEFHTREGPFTLVPLPGDRVSLVWVDRPQQVEAAARLDRDSLSRLVEDRGASIHGAMRVDSDPAVFPLHAALADRFAARRIMLVGEAAHAFPPIGAQGLNLGLRDVEALGRVLARHRADPGAADSLDAYHSARQVDVRSRAFAVDLLNRSLLTGLLPVQLARGAGLALAAALPPLRKAIMRGGLGSGAMRAPDPPRP